ncbi:MAG: D-sedoheptulose 7-phosphate isomerase [Bacteroidales bacterium]|jgi:D-sedoheptulose 7-phosphate isomerase|nr:D-sedoheptulose 7-phosphate isomerase [Bacteroidales bacterium]
MSIRENFEEAIKVLQEFLENEVNLKNIETAGAIMANAIKNGGKIFSCGNGGSMCDAMHFAEELTGSFREKRKAIPAIAISDPAHITCTANDFGWNYVFSRYIEALGKKEDVLLAISTSGNSANIIEAAKTAGERGMKIVALTGKDGGLLKNMCDVEIRSPQSKYSDRVQEIHIKVIHSLIEYIEQNT